MPPGTKVSFNLIRSSDDFFLMRKADATPKDTEKYRAIVSQCCLFVKVCSMSDVIFRELSTRYAKEDIKYPFRKIMIKAISIPASNQEFLTGNLFPDSENPMKIHFVLVKTKARTGDYDFNPFGFYRKWTVIKSVGQNVAAEIENFYFKDQILAMREEMRIERERNFHIYQQLINLQKEQLNQQPSTSRGKGKALRGRGSGPKNRNLRQTSDSQSETSSNITDHSFVTADPEDEPLKKKSTENMLAPYPYQDTTEETVFLKLFILEINSTPVDQVQLKISKFINIVFYKKVSF